MGIDLGYFLCASNSWSELHSLAGAPSTEIEKALNLTPDATLLESAIGLVTVPVDVVQPATWSIEVMKTAIF